MSLYYSFSFIYFKIDILNNHQYCNNIVILEMTEKLYTYIYYIDFGRREKIIDFLGPSEMTILP